MGPKSAPKAGGAAPARGKSSSPTRGKKVEGSVGVVSTGAKGSGGSVKSTGSKASTTKTSTKSDTKAAAGGAKGKGSKESPGKKGSPAKGAGAKGGKSSKDDAAKTKTSTTADAAEAKEVEAAPEVKEAAAPAEEAKPAADAAKDAKDTKDAKGAKAERPLNVNEGPSVITGKIFLQAAVDADIRALKTYLTLRGPLPGEVLNFQNNSQMTALMMAAQKKTDFESAEILKVILASLKPMKRPPVKEGDPPPAYAEGMCNPLSGHSNVPAGKLDVNMQNRDGYTALHFAARKGYAESLMLLLEADADYEIVSTGVEKVTAGELTNDKKCKDYLLNAVEMKAERARMEAIKVQGQACYTSVLKGDLRGVVRVAEKNSPPETYSYRPTKEDHYMLRHAIDLSHLEIFKEMLSKDAEKDVWDSRGRTPLMHIISLKRAGSYPTTKFSRDKEELRMQFLEQLLDNGVCTNTMLERRDKDGNTALHIACENGYIEDIIALLDKQVDVNSRQISEYKYRGAPGQRIKSGDTAFIITARRQQGFFACTPIGTSLEGNYMEVLATLRFEGKADVNLRGYNGMTALMWAAHNEDIELLDWLIEEGANINEQENYGQTALMQCMENLKLRSATFLLEFDLEEYIARKEREAAENAIIQAREEEEREARRKAKKKLLKLGANVDADTIAALDAKTDGDGKGKDGKNKSPKREKGPPDKNTLLKNRQARENAKINAKLGDKSKITRWPRMLGYYREQKPETWLNIRVPGADEDAPPKPPEECNPNVPALNDATPLIAICRKCLIVERAPLTAIVDLLLKKGANIDIKSSDGMSPLMWAVLNNDVELCKQLLMAGANPTVTDALGISLLDNCKSGAMRMTVKGAIEAWDLALREKEADEMGPKD